MKWNPLELLRKPSDFGWFGSDKYFDTWALGPVVLTRDSGLLEKANWEALKRQLEAHPEFAGKWELNGSSHWAVGHVDHLGFEVFTDDDKTTVSPIVAFLEEHFAALEAYPVADEELLAKYKAEAALRDIAYVVDSQLNLDASIFGKKWQQKVYKWLSKERDYHYTEDSYPDEGDVLEALSVLKLIGGVKEVS